MRKRQNCLKTSFIPESVSECIIHFNQGYFRPLILVKDMSDYIPHEYFFLNWDKSEIFKMAATAILKYLITTNTKIFVVHVSVIHENVPNQGQGIHSY